MLGVCPGSKSAVIVSAPTRRTSPFCADRTCDSLGKVAAWVPKRGRVPFAVDSLATSVRGTAGLVRIQGPIVQLRCREPAGAIEGGRADQYPERRRGTRFPPVAWFAMGLRVGNFFGNCFRRQHRRSCRRSRSVPRRSVHADRHGANRRAAARPKAIASSRNWLIGLATRGAHGDYLEHQRDQHAVARVFSSQRGGRGLLDTRRDRPISEYTRAGSE